MEKLLRIAAAELGTTEFAGARDNQRIVDYAQEIGMDAIKNDEVPWCSIFVNWVAKEAGHEMSHSASARSWLNVGIEVPEPEPGDVAVFWRESPSSNKGHVGFFLGFDTARSRIYVLGGNQGDSVSVSAYPKDQLLQFRRLRSSSVTLPDRMLMNGSRGHEVAALQDALKMLGHDCGTSDGHFGPRTEAALFAFEQKAGLTPADGVYDQQTRKAMLDLLNQN